MKQKGQGIVEFALVVPMLAALGIAIVYVGIMFLDYTQYSNAARDAARDISLQTKFISDESLDQSSKSRKADAMRQDIADALNGGANYTNIVERYQHPFTNIYEATWSVNFYKWNTSSKKLELNGAEGSTKAQGSKAVEVKIGMKLRGTSEYGSYLGEWLDNSFKNLPTITYKMVLEE